MDISLSPIKPTIQINFAASQGSDVKGNLRFTDFARKLVCLHQGAIAQFQCISGELHRGLRTAVEGGKVEEIAGNQANLDYFLNQCLKHVWMDSVELMRAYYHVRDSRFLPRFCIKAVRGENGMEKIIDLFRGDGKRTDREDELNSNTGFLKCSTNGRYYLENDIPKAARAERYKNPRLSQTKAGAYAAPGFLSKKRRKGVDIAWANCWVDYDENTPDTAEACYRSTLIVPMTLKGNKLTDYFRERTKVGADVERVIYGFLCMDHVSLDFFQDEDISLAYMVADLLSIYIIGRQNYVPFSETYKRATKILNGSAVAEEPSSNETHALNAKETIQKKKSTRKRSRH